MDFVLDFLLNFHGPTPYFVLFGILVVCGLGLPIPEDIVLFAGGLAAYYGLTELHLTIILAYLGVMTGDAVIFFLGAIWGRRLLNYPLFQRFLPGDRLRFVQEQFHLKGNKLIFAARFMPGLRAPIFFSAGLLHLPYARVFLFYDGLAALISVPVIVGAVYYFGDQLDQVVNTIKRVEHGIVFVIIALIFAVGTKWYISHRRIKKT